MTAKPHLTVLTTPPVAGQVDRWHICISGLSQQSTEQTGLQRLWLKLGALRDPATCVLLEPWDLDVEHLARLIWLCRPLPLIVGRAPPAPVVKLYGYSWGGWSAVLLARALREWGIPVRHIVLCDAVHRPRPFWLRCLAPTDWFRIEIPDNVRRVTSFRQEENRPRGHDVIADDPQRTIVYQSEVAAVEHASMDELRAFQATAEVIARSL